MFSKSADSENPYILCAMVDYLMSRGPFLVSVDVSGEKSKCLILRGEEGEERKEKH